MPQRPKDLTNPCPACNVKANQPCITSRGRRAATVHSARTVTRQPVRPTKRVVAKVNPIDREKIEKDRTKASSIANTDQYENLSHLKEIRKSLMNLPVSKFTVRELWYILAEPELETTSSRLPILKKIWKMNGY